MAVQVSPEAEVHVGVNEGTDQRATESHAPAKPKRTNNALERHKIEKYEDWALGEEAYEWYTAVIEWVLCPPPIIERIFRITLCLALNTGFIILVVCGLIGGNVGEEFALTVPTDLPLLIDLSGCLLVIRHVEGLDDGSLVFRNSTQRSAWQSMLALNIWSDTSSANRIVQQDCGDHHRLTCEVLQAEEGYLVSAVLEVASGTSLPAVSIIGHTQERSDVRIEGPVDFAAGLEIAGFEMHLVATELQTSTLSAKFSHGLVDVRDATFESAYVKVDEEGAVALHSSHDVLLSFPEERAPDNLCLTADAALPALNSSAASSTILLSAAQSRRRQPTGRGRREGGRAAAELTVVRKFANVSQVVVAVGAAGTLRSGSNTLDSTPGAMRIQANVSQAAQRALDADFEVLRFSATGPGLPLALNSGQDEFVWVKQGASYLWLSTPWMWLSSMTFFAPRTSRIPLVVQERVCIRKEEILVREAASDWVCPAETLQAAFQDYEDLFALLQPELQADAAHNATQAELKLARAKHSFENPPSSRWGGALTGELSITALNTVFDFRPYANVLGARVRIQDPQRDRPGPAGRALLALHWIIATISTVIGAVYIPAAWRRVRRKHLALRGERVFPGAWSIETGAVLALAQAEGGAQELTLKPDPARESEEEEAGVGGGEGGGGGGAWEVEGGVEGAVPRLHIKVGGVTRVIERRAGQSRGAGRLEGAEERVVRVAEPLPEEAKGDAYAVFQQRVRAKCRSSLMLWYFVDVAVAMEAQGYAGCPCVGLPLAAFTVAAHFASLVAVCLLPGSLSLALVLVDVCHCCSSHRLLAAGECQGPAYWPAIVVGSVTVLAYALGLAYTLVYYATDLRSREELAANPAWHIRWWRRIREAVKVMLMAMLVVSLWWVSLALLWLALGALVQPYKFVPLLLGIALVGFTARETYRRLKEARRNVKRGLRKHMMSLGKSADQLRRHYLEAKRLLVEEGVSEEGILMFSVLLAVMLLLSVAFILLGVTSFLHVANLTSTVVSSLLMLSTAVAVIKAGGDKGESMKSGRGTKHLVSLLEKIGDGAQHAADAVESPIHRRS